MLNNTQTWEIAVSNSLQNLWIKTISFLPNLFGAVIIFIVGVMISVSLGMLITKIMKKLKFNKASDEIGLTHMLEHGGIKTDIPTLIGETVKWFLFFVFLMAATDILNLPQITQFLNSILLYVPNVIVAVIILALTVLIANFIGNVISKSEKTTRIPNSKIIGSISKWAILVFGIMAALVQLGVATSLITVLFTGFVGMISIAGGLAFGLGGKDKARQILDKLIKN